MTISITDLGTEETPPSGGVSRYFKNSDVIRDAWGENDLTDNTSAGTTTDAIRGDAKSFDGTDDWMQIPAGVVSETTDFTVSVWFQGTRFSNQDRVYTLRNDILHDFRIGDASGNPEFEFYDGSAWNDLTTSATTDGWYHAVITYDDSKPEWVGYLNGTPVVTSANDSTSRSETSTIGAGGNDTSTGNLDGLVDDFRIYNRTFNMGQVAQLYRWGGGGRDLRQRTVIA